MKYIPGIKFINNTRINTKFFKRGVVYKLCNIKRIGDEFEYTFSHSGNILHSVKFKSVKEADNYLQTIVI